MGEDVWEEFAIEHECPVCGAEAGEQCFEMKRLGTAPESVRAKDYCSKPHLIRITEAITMTAPCPLCGVDCGKPCHAHGGCAEREKLVVALLRQGWLPEQLKVVDAKRRLDEPKPYAGDGGG